MKIDFRGEAHAVVRIEGRTDRLEASGLDVSWPNFEHEGEERNVLA